MDVDSVLASAPRRIRVEGESAATSYDLAGDLIATHGAGPRPRAVLAFEGGDVVVEPLAPSQPAEPTKGMFGPVYRQEPAGTVAVPTGRVFIRFAEGERAEDHRAELAASGYELEQVPSYAPHAAWARPVSGNVSDALRDLDPLKRIPDVEHLDPQFLVQAARRT